MVVKYPLVLAVIIIGLWADDLPDKESFLYQKCLACHRDEQIPSEMIYRRYLFQYSSPLIIKNQMKSYLKHPDHTQSILPEPFFIKFAVKEPSDLNETELERGIEAYMDFFDIKKRLVLSDN